MNNVIIHTDGGCEGNPGPGAWAAVLRHGERVREISGGELATTNNRMELTAALEALKALKQPCEIQLFTDSQYLRNGITVWIRRWKSGGWVTKDKQPVKNADLWRALDAACDRHRIHWGWLKGHAGHADNERCDVLARAMIESLKTRHPAEQLEDALKEFNRARLPLVSEQPRLL